MNQYKRHYYILAILIHFFSQGKGQDTISYCSCSMDRYPPIGVMLDHAHSKGEWMVSYRIMEMFMQGNLMGTKKVNDETMYQNYLMASQKMRMQMHMLMIMYGLSDKITVMGMLNYASNSMDMSMRMSSHMHMGNMSMADSEILENTRNRGLGDVKIYGLYSILKTMNHQLSFNIGISIPTGSISRKGTSTMMEDRKYSYSLQTGTGSFSVLPGITYTGKGEKLSWGTQLTADIKTGKNTAGYKWGNELVFTGWISRNWNDWLSNSLRLSYKNSGRMKGFDAEIASFRTVDPDADIHNYGGQRVHVYAGLNLALPPGVLSGNSIGIEYGVPIYQNLNGVQLGTKALINAGWQYAF